MPSKQNNSLTGGFSDNSGTYKYMYDKALKNLSFQYTDNRLNDSFYHVKDKNVVNNFLNDYNKISNKTIKNPEYVNFIKKYVKNHFVSYIPLNNNGYHLQIDNVLKLSDNYKSKTIKNINDALNNYKTLKNIFPYVHIVDDKYNDILHPAVINKLNKHYDLINDIKQTIIKSLLNGNSVLLKPRNGGINYSINSNTNKPFENIQQLYFQQIREDNHYKSPYFMPSSDVRKNGFTIKNKSLSTVYSNINKLTNKIEFEHFYNADQLISNNKTLDVANMIINTPLEIPFLYNKDIPILPTINTYTPNSASLAESFTRKLSEYFKSIYIGEPYTPPDYTKEEINSIISFINNDNLFFKYSKTAHSHIKNSLKVPVKIKKRDKVRML